MADFHPPLDCADPQLSFESSLSNYLACAAIKQEISVIVLQIPFKLSSTAGPHWSVKFVISDVLGRASKRQEL